MKSERPDLPLTIARLVRSATPVTPLAPPSVRLARWAITSTAFALVSVPILGLRSDVAAQMMNGWFVARATVTLTIVVAAAIAAFFMSVPGAERSRLVRALPLTACFVWAALLVGTIAANSSPLEVLLQVTPHPSCVLLIVATALLPGATLGRMLRDAAPLQATWTAGFAGLASLAVGALGAQFVCSNDAAAHHLLWHFTPVVLLAVAGIAVGSSGLAGHIARDPTPHNRRGWRDIPGNAMSDHSRDAIQSSRAGTRRGFAAHVQNRERKPHVVDG